MADPVLSPEIRPEWLEAAITSVVNAGMAWCTHASPKWANQCPTCLADAVLSATAPLIAAAARADERERIARFVAAGPSLLRSEVVAAIRSLPPEATE